MIDGDIQVNLESVQALSFGHGWATGLKQGTVPLLFFHISENPRIHE
jgi:hypothetical protein